MPSLRQMTAAPQAAPVDLNLPADFPDIPDDVKQRFPSLDQWAQDIKKWYEAMVQALTDANTAQSNVINGQVSQIEDLTPGVYSASAPAATGTVPWKDSSGKVVQVLVE